MHETDETDEVYDALLKSLTSKNILKTFGKNRA